MTIYRLSAIMRTIGGNRMKKKIIPVLLAIVLIVVIAAVAFGGKLLQRFTYSKEKAD